MRPSSSPGKSPGPKGFCGGALRAAAIWGALATQAGCSCGDYAAFMPAFGGSVESTEDCGQSLGTYLFDMGSEMGGVWMNVEPEGFYDELLGTAFIVTAVLPVSPMTEGGGDLSPGDLYQWGESLTGVAYWLNENTATMDEAPLTAGTVEILSELAPNEFLETRNFRVAWDLEWGDPGSTSAAWYTFRGEDKMALESPVWDTGY